MNWKLNKTYAMVGVIVASVCISANSVLAQGRMETRLEQGWQLVSLPRESDQPPFQTCVDSTDPALLWIFSGCCGEQCNVEQVRQYDNTAGDWLIFAPTPYPAELNTLTTINAGQGFWIKYNQPTTLRAQMSLTAALTQPTLELVAGWNLIGTGAHERRTWDMLFGRDGTGAVARPVDSTWQYNDQSGDYFGLDLTSNPPIGDTEWLESKRGIWVHASAPFTLGRTLPNKLNRIPQY